jgi:hypothetical protein
MMRQFYQYACLLLIATLCGAEESKLQEALPSGHGYMFIRMIPVNQVRVARVEMTNLDTNEVVISELNLAAYSGPRETTNLIPVPEGRYFWSSYTLGYTPNIPDKRDSPGSHDQVFEIVQGAVNYVGDWSFNKRDQYPYPIDVSVSYSTETLEDLPELYPEKSKDLDVYLSPMGKLAVSVDSFRNTVKTD